MKQRTRKGLKSYGILNVAVVCALFLTRHGIMVENTTDTVDAIPANVTKIDAFSKSQTVDTQTMEVKTTENETTEAETTKVRTTEMETTEVETTKVKTTEMETTEVKTTEFESTTKVTTTMFTVTTTTTGEELIDTENVVIAVNDETSDEDNIGYYGCNQLSLITEYSITEERISAAMEYFVNNGFSIEAAAGIVGNIAVESSFDPRSVSSLGYYGLCQWNTSENGNYWWYSVENWMINNGYDSYSFDGQIRAILECPNKGMLNDDALEELKSIKNVAQAAELFAIYYEGCIGGKDYSEYYNLGCTYQELDLRKSEAYIAYDLWNSSFTVDYYGEKPYVS